MIQTPANQCNKKSGSHSALAGVVADQHIHRSFGGCVFPMTSGSSTRTCHLWWWVCVSPAEGGRASAAAAMSPAGVFQPFAHHHSGTPGIVGEVVVGIFTPTGEQHDNNIISQKANEQVARDRCHPNGSTVLQKIIRSRQDSALLCRTYPRPVRNRVGGSRTHLLEGVAEASGGDGDSSKTLGEDEGRNKGCQRDHQYQRQPHDNDSVSRIMLRGDIDRRWLSARTRLSHTTSVLPGARNPGGDPSVAPSRQSRVCMVQTNNHSTLTSGGVVFSSESNCQGILDGSNRSMPSNSSQGAQA